MKINWLYICLILAIATLYMIKNRVQNQSLNNYFGTAEAESIIIKSELSGQLVDIRPKAGQLIKKGDTLIRLIKIDFDKKATDQSLDINQIKIQHDLFIQSSKNEINIINAQYDSKITELRKDLDNLDVRNGELDQIKKAFNESLNIHNESPNTSYQTNRKGIIDQIQKLEIEKNTRIDTLNAEIRSNQRWNSTKSALVQSDRIFLDNQRKQLTLCSPIDGFVEDYQIHLLDYINANTELLKITPQKPNYIRGFIPETVDASFALSEGVQLSSATRPEIKTNGEIIYCNPRIVELPTRLRKNPEIKAWGREVYIRISESNVFFIGEKIIITVPEFVAANK
ncbi:MAG: HlyD family efflux transporter periplasmic adaptor subunit [Saprospiraceae bacterium]|nr:HlyD family efflux transporter periplasmic adaptor subunit [Candidatus Defluviibacterium haderslevense]